MVKVLFQICNGSIQKRVCDPCHRLLLETGERSRRTWLFNVKVTKTWWCYQCRIWLMVQQHESSFTTELLTRLIWTVESKSGARSLCSVSGHRMPLHWDVSFPGSEDVCVEQMQVFNMDTDNQENTCLDRGYEQGRNSDQDNHNKYKHQSKSKIPLSRFPYFTAHSLWSMRNKNCNRVNCFLRVTFH